MRIPRVYLERIPESGEFDLPEEVKHYLKNVLRLKPGDRARFFDGKGREILVSLEGKGPVISKAKTVEGIRAPDRYLPERILAFSPPSRERLEWLIEKGTELGASRFILLKLERTPPRSREVGKKLKRLERIAGAACAQCGRAYLPSMEGPVGLGELLESLDPKHERILLDPGADARLGETGLPSIVLAGPEGGFTVRERRAIEGSGFKPYTLGPLTLRIETALLSALAVLGLNPGPAELK